MTSNQFRFLKLKSIKPELPLLIYLPGMDGTGKLFHVQAKRLENCFDLRCLTIPSDDLSNWDQLVEEVIQLIKQELVVNPQRSIYLCGESFGACLALKITLTVPKLIEKMILVNPASSLPQHPWLGWGVNIIPWLPSFIHKSSAVGLLPFLANLSRIDPSDRRALLDAMKSLPQQVVTWRLSLIAKFEIAGEYLSHLTQPTLIIAGGADRLLPSLAEADRLMQLLPYATIKVLPLSGHACLLETETNLYQIMKESDFLQPQVEKLKI
jgi:pimeloyl-ACP methyl ester carboxylesterase